MQFVLAKETPFMLVLQKIHEAGDGSQVIPKAWDSQGISHIYNSWVQDGCSLHSFSTKVSHLPLSSYMAYMIHYDCNITADGRLGNRHTITEEDANNPLHH